jgi:hypothetical protein
MFLTSKVNNSDIMYMSAVGGDKVSVYPLIFGNTARLQFRISEYCCLTMRTIIIMLIIYLFACLFSILKVSYKLTTSKGGRKQLRNENKT